MAQDMAVSMTQTWPPPGHSFAYKMEAALGTNNISLEMTLPGAVTEVNLATVRLGRLGGDTDADRIFRTRLYAAIGEITVAGGHADTAMMRLLALLTGNGRFSRVNKSWSRLLKMLGDQCAAAEDDPRLDQLQRLLDWAETNRVKARRDNAVHAYWWIYEGCGVVRSRFFYDEEGAVMIGSMEDLEQDAGVLFEFARQLDELLAEDWPRAMLPSE